MIVITHGRQVPTPKVCTTPSFIFETDEAGTITTNIIPISGDNIFI